MTLRHALVEHVDEIWNDAGVVGDVCGEDRVDRVRDVVFSPPELADLVVVIAGGGADVDIELNVIVDTLHQLAVAIGDKELALLKSPVLQHTDADHPGAAPEFEDICAGDEVG
ncbi:hypothetical protein PMKS-000976 [Pichia membranifaciens]|uniref:Uncharacterized protein n=1 Tax=Pichia membranifaciens TaxID=4926 RepID=A0A1Q2YDC5_9ASCO|nr:hypothetical protein PMKS-000976 [Pichia membranifaciens]